MPENQQNYNHQNQHQQTTNQNYTDMKKTSVICAFAAVAAGAFFFGVQSKNSETQAAIQANQELRTQLAREYPSENRPCQNMAFSSECIVDACKNGNAYWVIYDDVDAGMENIPIRVDSVTYAKCVESIHNGTEMLGTLEENQPDVYTFKEYEYERLYTSAE